MPATTSQNDSAERPVGSRCRAPVAPAPPVRRVLLLIESSRFSGRSLLRGVADYARLHGPWAFFWEPAGLEKVWPRLKSLDADGIILRDVERLDRALASGVPTVVVGHRQREIPGVANVVTDSKAIGLMAAEHLLSCGFRHFAYCGLHGLPWSILRGESFSGRLAEAGFVTHFYPAGTSAKGPGGSRGRAVLARWLTAIPKPCGLMACNDDRGEQVIEACKIAGLQVPDDIAIIGADNDDLVCDLSDPPLSSVAINFERAGFESARVLDQLMRGLSVQDPRILVAPTHVVTRQSTNTVAIEDASLAKALRFINERSRGPLSVPDVAAACGLSRRVLEKKFRGVLRRSVLREIRRVRVSQICRMLIETHQPITLLAQSLGYTGTEHLARYFRQEIHMTPLEYRRRYGRR